MDPTSPKKILIIDDEPLTQKTIAAFLKNDYQTLSCPSGPQALSLLEKEKVDIILLDIMMPAMNGYEVLNRIRANSATMHTPVIICTALNQPEDVLKAINSGAQNYLIKPFSKKSLVEKLAQVLGTDAGDEFPGLPATPSAAQLQEAPLLSEIPLDSATWSRTLTRTPLHQKMLFRYYHDLGDRFILSDLVEEMAEEETKLIKIISDFAALGLVEFDGNSGYFLLPDKDRFLALHKLVSCQL